MDLGGNWPWALVGSSFRKGSRKIGIASPHCISLAYINRPPHPPLRKHTPPRYHAKGPEYMSITLSYMEPAEFHIFLISQKKKPLASSVVHREPKKKQKKTKKAVIWTWDYFKYRSLICLKVCEQRGEGNGGKRFFFFFFFPIPELGI